MKLLGVSASPSRESKTLIAVATAIEYAGSVYPDITTEVLHLRDYDVQFCDGRDPALYTGDTRLVIDKNIAADALIIGTPIYRGSYTGVLKNLFDVLPNDALEGKAIGLVATGGTDHHFLAIEHELKPIIGFFYGHAMPGSVYANNSHYDSSGLVDEGIVERLEDLAVAVVEFGGRMPRHIVGAARPSIPRRALRDG